MNLLQELPLILAPGLSREFLLHRRFAPRRWQSEGVLVVATAPDALTEELEELGALYSAEIVVESAAMDDVEQLIERLALSGTDLETPASAPSEADLLADSRSLAGQPPVIRFVNMLIREAADIGASDIHLEATVGGAEARFRLDGVLIPAPEPPAGLHLAVASRIKLLAQLDVAERRRPQDGRIRIRLEHRQLDLRVSTVPTLHGESVVARLLARGERPAGLAALGLEPTALEALTRLAARPHGLLLATGPTGSGKTTTWYAALSERRLREEKVITVEDPIEYELPGVTQVPVRAEAGTTFAGALRAILRQDPDVLLVGEMRDPETAELAIQAAMTGHLVFSTLHTNDALSAIPRLLDLGVPAYLVAATLDAVLAQRLVRRVCEQCAEGYWPPPEELAHLGLPADTECRRGRGCRACRGTGYRGRTGIFELLIVSDDFRNAVAHGASLGELRALAANEGMRTLAFDGAAKVRLGMTSVGEVLRVVHN